MKRNLLLPACILIFLVMTLQLSCKKDSSPLIDPTTNTNVYNAAVRVNGSVSAFVTDENDLPVTGAAVTAGTGTATTDSRGFFEIKNVQLVKNAGFVTVDKTGYFKGIKTWVAEENKDAFFRIKLLPKTNAGTVSGTTGGDVTLTGGMKISFPASAVINASTNAAYTGTVTVNAKWLDPTSPELNSIMPGDLRGINTTGGLQMLTTYGMTAVELRGAGGELLQIAPSKKATLTMPIPAAISGSAPASMPLWSFDETKGLWKEEGTTTKNGSNYVGEVSHFSFWNCDVPANYVQFNVTVNDAAGNPLTNAYVKLTVTSSGVSTYGYTNAAGYVSGAIPANTQLLLNVLAKPNCSIVLHTQNFSSAATNISLGTISLLSNRTVRITGNLTTCNNLPVTNGRVYVAYDNSSVTVTANALGAYSVSFPICNSTSVNTALTGIDMSNLMQGATTTAVYQGGTTNPVNLQACGTPFGNEFFTLTYGTTPAVTYNMPIDSVWFNPNQTGSYQLTGKRIPPGRITQLYFQGTTLTIGQTIPVSYFFDNQINIPGTTGTSNLLVTISEFGASVVGYIAGTISGTVMINNTPVTVSGSFRARRP